jgi:hypothetical protein
MFNKLAALVGQAPAFPYTVGEARAGGEWTGWTHHAGVARDDEAPVSVWRLSARPGDARLELARHGVRKLKTVSLRGSERVEKEGERREKEGEKEKRERRFD